MYFVLICVNAQARLCKPYIFVTRKWKILEHLTKYIILRLISSLRVKYAKLNVVNIVKKIVQITLTECSLTSKQNKMKKKKQSE